MYNSLFLGGIPEGIGGGMAKAGVEKSQFDQFDVIGRNFHSNHQIELKFYEGS